MTAPLLDVSALEVRYGPVVAIRDLSLSVKAGTIIGLLGPNGAGKSTTLGAIAGIVPVARGDIRFAGTSIKSEAPEDRVRRGLSLVPENRRIFDNLTVEENLRLGASGAFGRDHVDLDWIYAQFPILHTYRRTPSGHLSGGEQQQLAIARALLAGPKLLLLDEPSLGLAPKLVSLVFERIVALREIGVTVVLAEQYVRKTLEIADFVYVLRRGMVRAAGTPREVEAAGLYSLDSGVTVYSRTGPSGAER